VGKSVAAPDQYTSHAIPPRTLLRVLALVDHNLSELEAVLLRLEARFIGASVLIVYEGEPTRLESALDRWEAKRAREALIAAAAPSEEDESDEDDYDDIDEDENSSTSSDDDEDDGAAADARRARRCPPVTLKMIDFAHTRLVEGEGPDEGVLMGVRTLRALVQGRAEAVRQEVYKQGQAGAVEA
jgi:1D-myo-inositol-tetrakisphosphate 5-kinase/inositol-polyphosphate multikinase